MKLVKFQRPSEPSIRLTDVALLEVYINPEAVAIVNRYMGDNLDQVTVLTMLNGDTIHIDSPLPVTVALLAEANPA